MGTRYLAIDVAQQGQTSGPRSQTGGAADNREALRHCMSQGYRYRGDTWALSCPAGGRLPCARLAGGATRRGR